MFISYVDYFIVKILLRKGVSKKIIILIVAFIGLLVLEILYNHFYTAFNTTFFRVFMFIFFSCLFFYRLKFANRFIDRFNKHNKD